MQRKLAAILSADVVGYSGLMEADETGTLERLKANRGGIFDPLVAHHGGRVFKLIGDGALAEFSSVIAAVECALAIQAETEEAARAGGLRYRIGINLGEVIVEGDDIYGEGVNVASRIQALAPVGGVCISRIVRDQIEGKTSHAFEDMGDQKVKNIERPVHVFAVRAAGPDDAKDRSVGEADKMSIAVLPFVNMSADPEQEYFSDGLTEERLNQLAQFKALRVIGRTSCFAFKGKNEDLRVIGQKLGVAHILEGSVRKAGKRLRITAQLIACAGHHHLWSQTYDRDLDDVFAIQDDVSRAVADALKVTLGVGGTAQAQGGTRNVEAYDLYLRATALSHQAGHATALRTADMMRRAVSLDPEFANAWLLLAESLTLAFDYGNAADLKLRSDRDRALDRAEAIAPDLWSGHAARADRLTSQRKYFAAEQAFDKAIALGPSAFPVANQFGLLLAAAGRMTEAIAYLQMIRKADPLRPMPVLQMFLVLACRYAEADTEYARAKDMAPGPLQLADWFAFARMLASGDHAGAKRLLARLVSDGAAPTFFYRELLAVFDDSDAAIAWIRGKLAAAAPEMNAVLILFAYMAAHFGAHDYALQLLRRHYIELEQSTPIVNIWHPLFAEVRQLPGFKDLVRDLGVYDYWRESGKWGDFARPLAGGDFELL